MQHEKEVKPSRRLIDTYELQRMLGIKSRSVLYDLMAKDVIPKPVRLGGRNRWDSEIVERWYENMLAEGVATAESVQSL